MTTCPDKVLQKRIAIFIAKLNKKSKSNL